MNDGQDNKQIKHYNVSGHAHELTFSCYRRKPYLADAAAAEILLEQLGKAREIYSFKLWAYVFMPNHVHLLLWSTETKYDIAKILSGIKGTMSKHYRQNLMKNDMQKHESFTEKKDGVDSFVFWQPGGGFDRNLWNGNAVHSSIQYIEANPVRKKLAAVPQEWPWSSAFSRAKGAGLIPDKFNIPVKMANARIQRVGAI